MHSPAPPEAVAGEVAKILSILGESDFAFAVELAKTPVNLSVLSELIMWNKRLASDPHRDRISKAGNLFWAAQTLVTTVMRSGLLDASATYSAGITRAMTKGADGLFEVGTSQFDVLAHLGIDLVNWLAKRNPASIALIESPIGNTVPVQFVNDLAQRRGLTVSVVQWNAPRNDRPLKGRTVEEAAQLCASDTTGFDCVVLLDEAQSGSRFIKLYDALLPALGENRFLPVAMLFADPARAGLEKGEARRRLIERLEAQGERMDFANPSREFPPLRLFKMDAGPHCRWQSPVIWGDSDLIAGKRKVNLIFTILDHSLDILKDLASDASEYRTFLEIAWSQNTNGQAFAFTPGLIQGLFTRIVAELLLEDFRHRLWGLAKERFPQDYSGTINAVEAVDPQERWVWFRNAFLKEAGKRLEEKEAGVAWTAIDATFAASFPERKPQPRRDVDATPYTLPFNDTVRAFNLRIREHLMAQAEAAQVQS
jgi:hypothetical protein